MPADAVKRCVWVNRRGFVGGLPPELCVLPRAPRSMGRGRNSSIILTRPLGQWHLAVYSVGMPTATVFPASPQNTHSGSRQAVQIGSAPAFVSTVTNVVRLRLIMSLCRLSQRDVCRATGYSKAFVSQLLSGKEFGAGERFWLRLNASLLEAVRDSAANVFDVAPVVLDSEQTAESFR